jgi:aldose sugar dehydrogenase
LKSIPSLAIYFTIYALIFAVLITMLHLLNNYTLLSLHAKTRIVQAAAFSPAYPESNSDFSTTATITKIQLPGIIPNNNNHSPPSSAPSPSFDFANTFNASSNNNNNNPPPPPITHNTRARPSLTGPTLNDPNLKVEQIIDRGFEDPTSMAFLGPNDILVLEKNTGKVDRILNGKVLTEPVLDVKVANQAERGLLGIAVANNDNAGIRGLDTVPPAGNRLYRYELDLNSNNNNKLTNPLLLLNLPVTPPPGREGTEKNHNGGKVLIGPDNNVYVGIGDVGRHRGQAENNPNGIAPDGTWGILRVTQDGQIVDNPPLGSGGIASSLYYAYGMRDTFGMDFDPVTGNLWDTENGNTFGDEINLVNPGFNSGWSQVAGIWEVGSRPGPVIGADSNNPPKDLDTFDGKGVYRAPEFTWLQTIAPTALKFLNSDRL